MRRKFAALASATAVLASSVLLSTSAVADERYGGHDNDREEKTLSAWLNGRNEVGHRGDRDGSGRAWFKVKLDGRDSEICYAISVRNLDRVTQAHIHKGERGENGPVVVPLKAPKDGFSKGCVDVRYRLARDILEDPHDYYANVHTKKYPDGAIRGQLR
ncbi:CHRD domain-containing protein [Georgenia yuyongxinii]|nr:CHRD domain-containing protein [Georgenia yuyongxinii]